MSSNSSPIVSVTPSALQNMTTRLMDSVTNTDKTSMTDTKKSDEIWDRFHKIVDIIRNSTDDPLIEPPRLEDDWTDWLVYFWRNLFPFIIWLLAMVWVCYLCFYNSRVFGLVLSQIVNRLFIKNGYFSVGSISVSFISGKFMFRDFIYVTEDYSVRCQDGWFVFRWWIPYLPKDVTTEDLSTCEARLLILLNGFELHIYNRTKRYKELEKLFGLPTRLNDDECDYEEEAANHSLIDSISDNAIDYSGNQWRDLIPVTKIEITSGRFVFGNHLIPSTLSIVMEESYFVYTTRPAVSPHDLFTHITKCKAENVKIILAPSPKFMGIRDEPPRFMGEGFVVFQSNNIDLYYYQDEPGLASDRPEKLELANGDILEKFTAPAWGLVIKCGKGTDFSYGPWADRQRELLYNFFYPSDYKPMEVSKRPKAGERREFESFDIRLSTQSDAKIDLLFTKNKETNAVHINAGPGSYLEITIPWINSESGYVSHINGQIMHLDATTSLQFRSLAVSETLEFDVKIAYPRIWNDHQLWTISLTGCKATVNLIYAHKIFFQALIEDWAGKARPDILKFVPYTCKIGVVFKEFELLTMANEYNWIDCSTGLNGENSQLAICGELFDMTFDLPFVEFLPPSMDIKIWIQGEGLEADFYLPESNTHRDVIEALHTYARITSRDGTTISDTNLFSNDRKWKNAVSRENHWYECWTTPLVALSIAYKYWPMPPKTFNPKETDITTPELEEILLSPMRPNRSPKHLYSAPDDFDPLSLEPDIIAVELEIGPSVIGLFGTLFRMLWNIKENYLGECQAFEDLSSNSFSFFDKFSELNQKNSHNKETNPQSDHMEIEFKHFDARVYRPFEVTVSVALHDIQAHLMKCCNESDPPCPSLYTEKLAFELHKKYNETQLQLLIAPIVLISTDLQVRPENNAHLKNGYLTLSSLQFRGHAMFSGVDRPLDSETLEYAWLVDVQLGDIAGRLTLPQIQHIVTPLETFLLQVLQTDHSLQPPFPYQKCLHDLIQSVCPKSTATKLCPYPEDLKYRMVRLSVDAIDVYVVESNVAISVQLIPIKFSMCNIHSCHTSVGITALVNKILVRQFVRTNNPPQTLNPSNSSKSRNSLSKEVSQWLEVSSCSLGPVFVDAASLLSSVDDYTQSQQTFLLSHDKKTKRLWFLWPNEPNVLPPHLVGKCGCVGGSAFFGHNKDGVGFFNLSNTEKRFSNPAEKVISDYYSDIGRSKDLAFGESLLHRGDYVLGVRVDTDECDEELLDLVPFFEEPFSPSISESMSDSKTELKSRFKYGFVSKQMSTNTGSGSLAPHSHREGSPSHQRSPTKSASFRIPQKQTLDPTEEICRRNRSMSESENVSEEVVQKSSVIRELIKSRQSSEAKDFDKMAPLEPTSPSTNSEVFRTKSLESASSASDRYFSAEDLSNTPKSPTSSTLSSSGTSKQHPIISSDSYHSAELPNILSDSSTQFYSCLNSESATLTGEDKKKMNGDNASINSSNSFISALSSHEDLALVDLRNQMEKPIPESPLLMSSYSSHLTQYVGYNWDIPPPVPQFTPSHICTKDWFVKKSHWRPRFRVSSHGFSCLRITRKSDTDQQTSGSFNNDFIPGSVFFEIDKNLDQKSGNREQKADDKSKERKSEELISKNVEVKLEKMTLLIKLKNEIDIKLSPLSLEGLKSFVDSLTPTLASLHPISVLNHLNLNCLNDVEANNKLKKEKMLYLGQLNVKAWQTLQRRQNSKQNNRRIENSENTSLIANQFEESKTFKLLSFVYINKININMIQASIVEEIISFAALDNIKDLTCVSVMTVSINDISLFSSHHIKQRRTLHTFMDQSSVSNLSFTEKALMSRFFSKKPKKELSEIESLTIETVDTSLDETVATAGVRSVHMQLSRLKNSSTILKDAILTVIPCRHSKVDFKVVHSQSPTSTDSERTSRQSRLSRRLQRQECVADGDNDDNTFLKVQQSSSSASDEEHLLGFIMFECGIEDISLKGVKVKKTDENLIELKPKTNDPNAANQDIEIVHESSHSSSGVVDVSTVWFNFAAPPKTPNTRKIDFTRLDWHLLSSAAPSISAWISVADRLILSAKCLSKLSEQRVDSVIVCLMISGLEEKGVHIPPQSKHLTRLFTPLAKSLQDDPSCQLVTALLRYYNTLKTSDEFEANLNPETLPCLSDLQHGIVALCRQWKNALYMPLFIQQNLRLRKGDNHPLRVLLEERSKQMSVETESNDDDTDENDETTKLLHSEPTPSGVDNPNIRSRAKKTLSKTKSEPNEDSNAGSNSAPPRRKASVIQSYLPRSTRASIVIPPLITAPFETIGTGVNKAYEYLFSPNSQNSGTRLMKREESQGSLKSSVTTLDPNALAMDQLIGDNRQLDRNSHDNYGEENLYWWMARQQDYMKNVTNLTNSLRKPSAMDQESKLNTLNSVNSMDETNNKIQSTAPDVSFLPTVAQMGDVREVFHPFMSSLRIAMNEENSASCLEFGQFGTKVSICGRIKLFKIDIVESENRNSPNRSRSPSRRLSPNRLPVISFDSSPFKARLKVDTSSDASAFVCEGLGVEFDLRKVKDFEKSENSQQNDQKVCSIVIVGPDGMSQTTTLLNFSVDINCIDQRVNLPLLRLLHQFTAMYENVKETRLEMRSNRVHSFIDPINLDKEVKLRTSTSDTTSHTPSSASFKHETHLHTAGHIGPHKEAVTIDMPEDSDSDVTLVEEPVKLRAALIQPKCWKTMYYLLDLYQTKPETKTVIERVSSLLHTAGNVPETKITIDEDEYKGTGRYEPLKDHSVEMEDSSSQSAAPQPKPSASASHQIHRKSATNVVSSDQLKNFTNALIQREWTPIVVFGVCKIKRVGLLAMLSGLKLEGELSAFHVSVTHKHKCRGSKKWFESSLNGQLGQTAISLLEEMPQSQQLVVKMTVGKSQTLISCQNKKGKDSNSALLTIGPIAIDIPQHPVALHGMMTRSGRQLSTTLQELRSSRQPSRLSRQQMDTETMTSSYGQQTSHTLRMDTDEMIDSGTVPSSDHLNKQQLIKPIVVQFSVILDSFTIGASLLPSLRAQYQIGRVTSSGITGSKAKFVIDVHQHTLSFNTKVLPTEANLPSSANVDLPQIHVSAEYMDDMNKGTPGASAASRSESFAEGIVLRKGSYLNATADIGSFEHSLTTDLLNHLLLVQKVFMKEVNEVVQKMSGTDTKIIDEDLFFGTDKSRRSRYVLFSLHLRLKGIQITATTPTSSAVRLETGLMELQLSNRVQNMSTKDLNLKLFIKLQVELNVALGQLIRNAMFEEAEPEFQQLAYFKTRISMRNALQDEMVINSDSEDKEAVLIALHRPLVYIQPLALDKAVLVWLNYKNAYEYWNEQRSNLNSEVVLATQQVLGKVQPITQIGSQTIGTLFLQLTVDDLGACLPITNPTISALNQSRGFESELKDALVVTLENTQISACSRGSLVSKAQFTGLCIRFADDFETSLDDWKPDLSDPSIKNLCMVSEGTYEICSRTITSHQSTSDAKWLLNVSWKMEGFDIHFDTSIGKHFSALFKTMTLIAGDEDEDEEDISTADYGSVVVDETPNQKKIIDDELESEPGLRLRKGSLSKDLSKDYKKRSRIIEKELNEQVKIISDLRQLGASHTTIEQEVQRLHELEAAVFNNFRRDVIKKLRRPSVRQSSFKDKLSVGNKMFSTSLVSHYENDFNEQSGDDSPVDQVKPGSFDTAMDSYTRLKTSSSIPIPKSQTQPTMDSPVSPSAVSDTNSVLSESQSSSESAQTPTFSLDRSSSSASEFKIPKISKNIRSDADPRKQGSLSSEYDESVTSSVAERSLTTKQSYQIEPNIDFELDVKIFFNSGKCVLHTKEQTPREEDPSTKKMQKERSFSGGPYDSLSPNHINKSKSSNRLAKTTSNTAIKPNISSSRLKHPTHVSGQIADFTVFLIPGLDIKLHYNSKTGSVEDGSQAGDKTRPASEQRTEANDTGGTTSQQSGHLSARKMSSKKASLFAWITLHSIPDETLISPNILDFLEQALEPIPITMPPKTPTSAAAPNVFGENEASVPAQYATYAQYASFPVDVIVYFHVQPTVVRFCCLPVSRVECLLHLPSIDLVFSSKRSEDELQAGQYSPPKYARYGYKSYDKHSMDATASTSSGGLSVTGCLADFSLYIFHPYGGQKKFGSASSSKESTDPKISYSDRKDSLSLQVEFVKINISRGRKLSIGDSVAQSFRFSATCDIGSASFKYDMRRLNEILAFPKAWYRKSIWKRMFIGDHSISAVFSDQEDDSMSADSKDSDTSSEESNQTATTVRTFIRKDSGANREGLRLDLQDTGRKRIYRNAARSDSRPLVTAANPWETLVLFSVNLSKLNITMNMGNVMGNTSWLTRGLRSDGRLSIDSTGHKNYKIGLALDGSTLDAKGGIVGGNLELSQISTELAVKEVKGMEPQHKLSCSLHTLENRIDYMGTSILMVRVSDLDITLRDEWRIDLNKNYNQATHPTKRPALIFIHGVLIWDQMQILMSKSTTPDLMKIMMKLEEFFSQQFHSSKRVFSSLQPNKYNRSSFKGKTQSKRSQSVTSGSPQLHVAPNAQQSSADNVSITTEARHHRHWQKALRLVSGVHLSTLPNPLPSHGTILGGTVELRAQNISLACFYGINFRSKSWGAFSLRQPSISFSTEAQSIVSESGALDTHVVQNLSFMLGRTLSEQQSRKTMATVCKISRNVMFPPQFRHMHEWFHYAFSASEIDDVDRFPAVMELDIFGTPIPQPTDSYFPSPQVRDRRASASPKTSGEYHHTQEVIFAFPSMQLELKTEHLQACTTPNPPDVKPRVDCTFVSDFDDHIFVAVDAEAYFFLHELISSYLIEKDTNPLKSQSPSTDKNKKNTESIEAMQRDWREFVCHVWHLEPTVRLLSWAGKNIEPYGVDYILQRLGFSQARTTIPKWIQRSTMDGFDKLLALTMFAMLLKAREDIKDDIH